MDPLQRSITPSNQDLSHPARSSLVLFVSIQVKEIARLGRLFPWQKPACCPDCQGPLWWHDFVLAYFSCLSEAVYLRRLRCSCCASVHKENLNLANAANLPVCLIIIIN